MRQQVADQLSQMPPSQTDPQADSLRGGIEKEVETAQNPAKGPAVQLRLLEGTKPEEQPPEGPQNDVWLG